MHWIVVDDNYPVGYHHQFFICAVLYWIVQGPVLVVVGGPEVLIEPTMCDPGILWSGHSQLQCLYAHAYNTQCTQHMYKTQIKPWATIIQI